MDTIVSFLDGLTLWHWVALGIILLVIEVAIGTFDLLWVSIGAFLTALFVVFVPPPAGAWQGQMVFFGIAAIVFVISGRTVFRGLRRAQTSHPHLNDRLANMVGQHGEAATVFVDRRGKVKVGDTVWLAAQADAASITVGDAIVVTGSEGSILTVRRISA
jgi:inner membrane protein